MRWYHYIVVATAAVLIVIMMAFTYAELYIFADFAPRGASDAHQRLLDSENSAPPKAGDATIADE